MEKRKKLNKLLTCLLAMFAMFMLFGMSASADGAASMFDEDPNPDLSAATSSFQAGEDVTAYFYEDTGLLYFKGSGAVQPLAGAYVSTHKLRGISPGVTHVYFTDGITELGRFTLCDNQVGSLSGFRNVTAVRLPETLTDIGDYGLY